MDKCKKKLYNLYPEKLEERYGITELDDDYIEAYEMIAKKRGAISKGGIVDYEKVSNIRALLIVLDEQL